MILTSLVSLVVLFASPSAWSMGQPLPPEMGSVDGGNYDHLDPQRIVPDRALERAVRYFDANRSRISNQRYLTVIDLSKHASQKRMFVVDMRSGAVRSFTVAHGRGSDPDGDGWARTFSNKNGSKMSSLGFYLTGSLYTGENGPSMRMHGLEASNSNAYSRAIVMHGASYVTPTWAGRSWGCPAVEQRYISTLRTQLAGGSLMSIHYNQ